MVENVLTAEIDISCWKRIRLGQESSSVRIRGPNLPKTPSRMG
jgi:hypothetical protein